MAIRRKSRSKDPCRSGLHPTGCKQREMASAEPDLRNLEKGFLLTSAFLEWSLCVEAFGFCNHDADLTSREW